MAAELAIRITADGKAVVAAAQQATGALQGIDAQAGRTAAALQSAQRASAGLNAAMASLGTAGVAFALVREIDGYTKFTAQLKLASTTSGEYAASLNDVRRISRDAQSDLASTGVLYARIANGTRELGIGQAKVAQITETINLALKVSGATAAESSSAMLQLSQSFASGTLRGEEFNAVNEAAPRLMKALADGIGVPVGALKEMASNGLITTEVMSQALPKALADLREEAKSVQTISGAFAVLKNNVMEFVGVQAQANGVVSAAASGLGFLANHLDLVAAAAGGLVTAKLAEVMLGIGVATAKNVGSTVLYAEALAAQRLAAIGVAQAEMAAASATSARMVATEAMLVMARQEAIAALAGANATIASSQAQIAAARSAGALSFALALVREGELALSVAMQARSVATAELAVLGQQQARVSVQIAAATAAQTAAQVALTAASSAGGAAAGLAARALGFLGGPSARSRPCWVWGSRPGCYGGIQRKKRCSKPKKAYSKRPLTCAPNCRRK